LWNGIADGTVLFGRLPQIHETKDEEVDVSAVYAELLKIIRGYYALDRQYPHQNGSRVDSTVSGE